MGIGIIWTKGLVHSVPRKKERMKRLLYVALAGLVFVLAVLVGTVISAVFLGGVEL